MPSWSVDSDSVGESEHAMRQFPGLVLSAIFGDSHPLTNQPSVGQVVEGS